MTNAARLARYLELLAIYNAVIDQPDWHREQAILADKMGWLVEGMPEPVRREAVAAQKALYMKRIYPDGDAPK